MRISDWSSDVCSSDLVEEAVIVADGRRFDAAEQHRRVNFDSRIAGSLLTDNALEPVVLDQVLRQHRGGALPALPRPVSRACSPPARRCSRSSKLAAASVSLSSWLPKRSPCFCFQASKFALSCRISAATSAALPPSALTRIRPRGAGIM